MQLIEILKNIFSIGRIDEYTKYINFLFHKFKYISPKYPILCILDPGGIGDYLFCRPYFQYIKKSPKYKNFKVFYVGNDIHSDFVKFYDSKYFDKILKWNGELFINDELYRKSFIKYLNKFKIHTLINLRCTILGTSRDYYPRHKIAKKIKAKEKYIECIEFDRNCKNSQNKIYNHIIKTTKKEAKFELERRKRYFEEFLETKINDNISLKLEPFFDMKKKHIAISIMAVYRERMFAQNEWVKVLNYIIDNIDDNTDLLFLGAESQREEISELISHLKDKQKCINLAGKTQLSILPTILNACEFLLSVETGTVHIAHSVACPSIVLCNGSYYGRFQPYDDNLVKYIYPRDFQKLIEENNPNILIDFYNPNTKIKTSDIETDDIIKVVNEIIGKKIK